MSYDLIFAKANDLYNSGALNQAEALYRQILETAPDHPDVNNMLGLIAQAKGLHKEAADFFYRALKTSPTFFQLYFNLAVSLAAAGQLREALHIYDKAIRLKPDLKEAYNNIAAIYEQLKEYDKAEMNYRQALVIDPDYIEPSVNLALLKNDDTSLKSISELHTESPLPVYHLARKAYEKTNYVEARNLICRALDLDKENSADLRLLAGLIELKLENTDGAVDAFQKVLALNPRCVPALINLANLLKNEDYYLKAISLQPDNPETHAAYGRFLYLEQRLLEALEAFRKAILINPDLPQVSNNLGLILKDRKEYEKALDLFFNALLKLPDNHEISINIAETLHMLFQIDPERAKNIASSWLKTTPNNAFALHTSSSFTGQPLEQNQKYVQVLFDNFAATYEKTLEEIKYNIFDKIKELKITLQGKILDLGCGTGLAAKAFKNDNNQFDGVDISANMLKIASAKKLYERLIQDDIINFLQNNHQTYELVMALDVLNYIKDLEKIFRFAKKMPLIFTVENASEEVETYLLAPTGRFQHNPDYILKLLQQNGYKKITQHTLELRMEGGQSVKGTFFMAMAE